MALMLVACTSGQPDMPRATAGSMPSEGESGAVSDVIFVVPPEGAPLQTGLVLADAIAAEIRVSNHPAILAYHTNQAGASVVGKILSAVPRGNVTWLTMDWAIRAPYGTLVDTYRQRVVIDKAMWDRAAPEAINLVIADAAPKIVKMVSSQIGPPVMATMTHRNWRDQSNEDQFKDKKMIEQEVVSAAKKTNSTTMGARMAEHQTNRSATEIGGPQVASLHPPYSRWPGLRIPPMGKLFALRAFLIYCKMIVRPQHRWRGLSRQDPLYPRYLRFPRSRSPKRPLLEFKERSRPQHCQRLGLRLHHRAHRQHLHRAHLEVYHRRQVA